MSSDALQTHRRQKGPPADKRESLEQQGVAKKAEQGQKLWATLGLQELKGWELVLPLWDQLQWYKYTGAKQGGALFAHWPDSDQWGADVWTASVPNTVKELALRQQLAVPDASSSQPETSAQGQPEQSQPSQSEPEVSEYVQAGPGSSAKTAVSHHASLSAATRAAPAAPATRSCRPTSTNTDTRGLARKHNTTELTVRTVPIVSRPGTTTVEGVGTPKPGSEDPAAPRHYAANLLMALGSGEALPMPPVHQADKEWLLSEDQVGFPRFLCKIRDAADEYVQHEARQCDMATDRWRAEYTKAHRQLNASETLRLAMEQRHKAELKTALMEQQQRLLQQQADLVREDQERIKELETELASSARTQVNYCMVCNNALPN
ncbi:hypothetical protein WJX73_004360 [Symbiochloris irregularis]|uniref:Uncharacterized protein n=1 Tax=Symbiochloris irregularis TaxID=706552 RepID=A0AAW1NSY7_9CHLO